MMGCLFCWKFSDCKMADFVAPFIKNWQPNLWFLLFFDTIIRGETLKLLHITFLKTSILTWWIFKVQAAFSSSFMKQQHLVRTKSCSRNFMKMASWCKIGKSMSDFSLIVGIAISQLPEGTEICRQHCSLFRPNCFPVAFLVVNLSSICISKPCLLTLVV